MKFVATKTADQLDLQALHRVRERLVSQRTGVETHWRRTAGPHMWVKPVYLALCRARP